MFALHGKNHQPVAMLMRTGLNNIVLTTLFKVVNNVEHLSILLKVTMLFNVVDNLRQCGQHNIFNPVLNNIAAGR